MKAGDRIKKLVKEYFDIYKNFKDPKIYDDPYFRDGKHAENLALGDISINIFIYEEAKKELIEKIRKYESE